MSVVAVKRRVEAKPARTSVLIVGGTATIRNAHAIELGTHGYDVECADNLEAALEICSGKPRALVLFAMDERSGKAWDVYRLIATDHPEQPLGFALNGTLKLCAVSFGDAEVIQAQGTDDLVSTVEALIGSPERLRNGN